MGRVVRCGSRYQPRFFIPAKYYARCHDSRPYTEYFNNHADRVRIANLAQCVNVLQAVILTDKEKMILTPTYHVMEMYNVHQDATLIPVTLKGTNYVQGNDSLPALS